MQEDAIHLLYLYGAMLGVLGLPAILGVIAAFSDRE